MIWVMMLSVIVFMGMHGNMERSFLSSFLFSCFVYVVA